MKRPTETAGESHLGAAVKLRIELGGDVFCPGERVSGRLHVAAGGGSRSLDVLLRFIEESPDYRTVARNRGGRRPPQRRVATGQVVGFSIELPADVLLGACQTMPSCTGGSRSAPTS